MAPNVSTQKGAKRRVRGKGTRPPAAKTRKQKLSSLKTLTTLLHKYFKGLPRTKRLPSTILSSMVEESFVEVGLLWAASNCCHVDTQALVTPAGPRPLADLCREHKSLEGSLTKVIHLKGRLDGLGLDKTSLQDVFSLVLMNTSHTFEGCTGRRLLRTLSRLEDARSSVLGALRDRSSCSLPDLHKMVVSLVALGHSLRTPAADPPAENFFSIFL